MCACAWADAWGDGDRSFQTCWAQENGFQGGHHDGPVPQVRDQLGREEEREGGGGERWGGRKRERGRGKEREKVRHYVLSRDLGLMVEAEELLSDICKFYSEDQWSELSTKAYSLLADCQMKLKLEDK